MSELQEQSLKRIVTTIISMIVLSVLAGCGGMVLSSNWISEKIKVDGKIDDWSELKTVYFEEEAVSLGIANDSTMLYLMFRTRNEIFARSIRMFGLRLKLKPKIDDGLSMNILYRGGDFVTIPALQGYEQKPNRGMQETGGVEQFTVSIKKRLSEMEIATDGSNGPSVSSDTSMTFYAYELGIPLSETLVRYYGLHASVGSKIEVTATWGGDDREMMRPDPTFDGGSRRGAGGIPGVGGGFGSGAGRKGGERGSQKRHLMQAYEVKFDIQLATLDTEMD